MLNNITISYRGEEYVACLYETIDDGLLSLWTRLESECENIDLYSSCLWHLAASRATHKTGRSLSYLTLADSHGPLFIFPFGRVDSASRVIEFGVDLTKAGVRNTPIASRCDSRLLMSLVRLALQGLDVQWDYIVLAGLKMDSLLFRSMAIDGKFSTFHYVSNTDRAHTLQSKAGPSKKYLTNLRRLKRTLVKQGDLDAIFSFEKAEMRNSFQQFVALEDSTWKGHVSHSSLARDAAQKAFFESIYSADTDKSEVSPFVGVLNFQGSVIAALLGVTTPDSVYIVKICFDEAHGKSSPGSLLMLEAFEHFGKENKYRYFDFMTSGRSDYWRPETRPVAEVKVFNASPKAIVLYGVSFVLETLRVLKRTFRKRVSQKNN